MTVGKFKQTNNDVEMVGDEQQSSLSSSVRERRSRESHCKSSTSSHIRSRGRSQPKRSQLSSALVDEDGVVCPITPSTAPKFVTSSSSNSLPTLSTRESSSVSTTTSSPDLVVLLNKDSKYKACPNITLQRHLNESIKVSSTTTMDINNKSKSDLGSSELTLLTSNVQGKGVTRSSEKDERGGTFLPTFGADGGWKIEEGGKDEEENEMDKQATAEYKENELKEGKGVMLCMPVTEVSYFRYFISLVVHMICSLTHDLSSLLSPGTRYSSSLSHHHMVMINQQVKRNKKKTNLRFVHVA